MKFKNASVLGFLVNALASSALAANPVWVEPKAAFETPTEETPLFVESQGYLEASPRGVGAIQAWSLPGGRGENVRIVDVETGFDQNHEDLPATFFAGANPENSAHGTAVSGILAAPENPFGVTGIAHRARFGFYGFIEGNLDDVTPEYIAGINRGIRAAVAELEAGDVLVIEQHMVGPDAGKYTAVEYWKEIFDELKAATAKGIHCVEAAGNGNSDFDSPVYEGAFDSALRDSGCILVGAGSWSKERMYFSNYGSRVDAFGYGIGVTATGYGDLFNGGAGRDYTAQFSGTSSATPIVAGAVALVSSIAEARGKSVTPEAMRVALRATGVPQGAASQAKRIGNFPNVEEILKFLGL